MEWNRTVAGASIVALVGVACSGSGSDDGSSASVTLDSAPARTAASIVERDDWGTVFDDAGVEGTFVLHEVGSDEILVYDAQRAAAPRIPASTFKILNSLVILETGAVADVDEVVEWDGVERSVPEWNADHDLRSAIELSAVWVYQELARRVGEERMAELVAAAGYGNTDIGGGVDQFWLSGDLRISPLEQIEFLERLVEGDLPFSEENMAAVREIIVRDSGDGWTWSHKTGTALSEDPGVGWLVGTTDYEGSTWVFAMNIDLGAIELPSEIDPRVRQQVSRTILATEGALPPQ